MNLFQKLTELNVHSLHIIAILKPSPLRPISENLSFRWKALQHTTSSNLVNKIITLIINNSITCCTRFHFNIVHFCTGGAPEYFWRWLVFTYCFFISTKLLFPFQSSSPLVFFAWTSRYSVFTFLSCHNYLILFVFGFEYPTKSFFGQYWPSKGKKVTIFLNIKKTL